MGDDGVIWRDVIGRFVLHTVSALGTDGGETEDQSGGLSVSLRCRMAGLTLRVRVRSSE